MAPNAAGTCIGADTVSGEPIWLGDVARDQGCYVIGRNGSGKSTLLEHFIAADMAKGLGVCLLDPHRDLVDRVLAHIPANREADVVLLDVLQPDCVFGLNLFACDDPGDAMAVSDTVERVLHVFEKAWGAPGLGPRNAQYLRNCARVIIANRLTMAEIPRLLTNREFRQRLVRSLPPASPAWDFWEEYEQLSPREQESRRESTLDKVDAWLQSDWVRQIVGQRERRLDFRSLLDERAILLVKLDANNESLTKLIGSVVVMELMKAGLSRADMPEAERWQRRCMLYADEFDYFATRDFQTILKGTRKYGICTTIAHQERSGLSDELRGATLQVGNLICFGLIGPDAEVLAGEFAAKPEERVTFRRQEKLALSQRPVEHLLTATHAEPDVQDFTKYWLVPIDEAHQRLASRGLLTQPFQYNGRISQGYAYDVGRYCIDKQGLLQALQSLNACLVGMMQYKVGVAAPDTWPAAGLAGLLFRCAEDLRAYVGFAEHLEGVALDPEFRYDTAWPRPTIPLAPGVSTALQDYCTRLAEAEAEYWQLREDAAVADAKGVRFRMQPHFEAIRERSNLVRQKLVDARAAVMQSKGYSSRAAELADEEVMRLNIFLSELLACGRALAKTPILVGTGQYEELPDAPRTVADIRNAIVSELTVQPRGHARVAIYDPAHRRVEHTVITRPRDGDGLRDVPAVEELTNRARLRICREFGLPRRTVDADLAARRQVTPVPEVVDGADEVRMWRREPPRRHRMQPLD